MARFLINLKSILPQTKFQLIPFVVLFIWIGKASAAPCCAGSNAIPALITGDELMQWSSSISTGKVIADAPASGQGLPVFRNENSPTEFRNALTVSFASLVDHDRTQVGISIPVLFQSITTASQTESSTGLSDISLNLGYELIPEFEYSDWKPKVYLFGQLVLPTGSSTYESSSRLQTDVRGLGLFQTHLGLLAVKTWSNWDAMLALKAGQIWGKTITLNQQSTQIGNFSALQSSFNIGYSFGTSFRFGTGVSPSYQSGFNLITDNRSSDSDSRLVWDTLISLSILVGQNETFSGTYSDQTLLGPAYNSSLLRTFSLAWIHRFER